jgi:WD40 repeat protein
MYRFRISIFETLMVMALVGILVSFLVHVNRQTMTRETVQAIEISPDGQRLARASDLGVAVFDMNTRRLVTRFNVSAGCLAFSPDSKWIATGGIDGSVQLWDLTTGKTSLSLEGHSEWVRSIAFSPDSSRLYSASRDATVKVWQLPDGELLTIYQAQAGIESVALSPKGNLLAVGVTRMQSTRHDIELWNTETGSIITTLSGPEYCYVYNLSFSSDGRALAVGLSVPMVRIWDVSDGTARIALPNAEGRDLVAFSPSGERLTTGYYGGAQVWDTTTGTQIAKLGGHSGEVLYGSFSDDESALTTAGRDGSVKTWDLKTFRLSGRVSALTVRPSPVPWHIVSCFGVWLAVWCGLAYRTRRRDTPDAVDKSVQGFILVLLAATYFIANGMAILWLTQEFAFADPISLLLLYCLVSFALLVCASLTIVLKAIRRRVVFWLFSVAVIMVALCYDLNLLCTVIALV